LKHEISDLIGEPVVAVRLNVSELKKEIEFSDIQIIFEHDKGKQAEVIYRLLPPTVSIKADIPQGMIGKPNGLKSLFQVKVYPETLKPGSLKLKVLVVAPSEIKIISVSPDTATLDIIETRKLKIKK